MKEKYDRGEEMKRLQQREKINEKKIPKDKMNKLVVQK